MNKRFPCVIPTIADDYERTKGHYIDFFRLLPINSMIFIGPEQLMERVEEDISAGFYEKEDVYFIKENDLVDFTRIKTVYDKLRQNANQPNPSSVNWYYQQFLKMAYSKISESEYYLCWDSDTVPVRKINMINDDGQPYLDVKTEYQPGYFITIERLFGIGKLIEKSFVSEHMLFNTNLMMEMINEIEESDIEGNDFCEKILNAVGFENLVCGFSEYETYGSWVAINYPTKYRLRNWNSLRNFNFFIGINDIREDDIAYLARDYDAVTFEKYQKTEPYFTELFRSTRYREKLTPKQFYTSILESGVMGDYENGALKYGGVDSPT